MNGTLKRLLPLMSRRAVHKMEWAAANPREAQERFLRSLLKKEAHTAFGKEHGFADITSPEEYRSRVPIRDYEGFRPYIDRMLAGEKGVLSREEPFMYATTSGTTGQAKLVPITKSFKKSLSSTSRYWLSRVFRDHPNCFDGAFFIPTSPAIEGYTERGVPYGSMTGLTYQTTPRLFRRSYAVPYEVVHLKDYDLRYYAMMRFALEKSVTFALTANPSTWLRLAQMSVDHGPKLVKAIHDGVLGTPNVVPPSEEDADVVRLLSRGLKKNPARARMLEQVLTTHGVLRPRHAWPELDVLVCWLGGSAGVQARLLAEYYGSVDLRDVGFRASEATISLPTADWTAAGVLANHVNYYEFVPEAEIGSPHPTTLGAHELTVGETYHIILTTLGGLYRYDINDVVLVQDTYAESPVLAFLRKGKDMASLTGEKLHVNQVIAAVDAAEKDVMLGSTHYCLIPDIENMRYDLLVEVEASVERTTLEEYLTTFDRYLGVQNDEYRGKRASGRLHRPTLRVMRRGWYDRAKRRALAEGMRDVQYKWPIVQQRWAESYEPEILLEAGFTTPVSGPKMTHSGP